MNAADSDRILALVDTYRLRCIAAALLSGDRAVEMCRRCDETLAELRGSLSACVAEWLPITDEQCDGRTYIVGRDMGTWGFVRGYGYFSDRPHQLVSGWICRGFTDPPGELGLGHPTHYQPLPPPPTKGEMK